MPPPPPKPASSLAPGLYERLITAIIRELDELLPLLDDLSDHVTYPLDEELGWDHRIPLSVHARHTVRDVLTAFGLSRVDGSPGYEQKGVFRDDRTNSDLFFVTLEKSERDYSPSTLYKDYAISPTEFHWESQSGTSQQSPTGQRYIRHRERAGHILLFVRQRRKQDGRTVPYTFLGPCDHVSHRGDRPVALCGDCAGRCPRGCSGTPRWQPDKLYCRLKTSRSGLDLPG